MTEEKEEVKPLNPFIETKNLDILTGVSGNIYKSLNIISKRANQLSAKQKEELHKKLEEFASTTDNLEEVMENREQIEISKFYERMPKTVLVAMKELLNDEIYIRNPEEEEASEEN